jgi:hypothetical protein
MEAALRCLTGSRPVPYFKRGLMKTEQSKPYQLKLTPRQQDELRELTG